ncbi:3-oxoacyl-ACP reductase [Streptomyces avermitilis]|uniref:3-oxoacyl-ACP reductase n=2 Tax=Streptomyces avermitilis TaxID=33903 RepID=Q79Z63_STRAW|nr:MULTISPECIES: SDR family oxidoreductase [Streptomyces]KUN56807.1 3-oxoacyl-ACP reductase [Streptomyces avermitilis]MYS99249.1 SDR family oxidoreductase [Streptomyces sp. SID5469]OOV32464.1 3-oxoacyl-ACP reductase [Streptomyces avermitilis]BAB69263.1 3-oxoacyl-(acyl carrier protein) reductase [Streptomyces avermitilis]BAC71370.1 putative 3-oxoacyl-ACP reductase [Streptomyces avermitilis MA-4680 = NBRC 14893]
MLKSLEGSWCLVLGASSGIGRAIALGLAREGVHVAGVHFDTAARAEEVEALVEEIRSLGVEARFFNTNAASKATRAELVPQLAELTGANGGIRILVHSLAFGTLVPFTPREGWDRPISVRQLEMTLDVMAHSLVYWTQDLLAAGLLRSGSKVYAMTSAGTSQHLPSYGAVSAAKSALESHVRQLAAELATSGIAVNALRAGTTVTPALQRIPEHAGYIERAAENNPHGRLTRPDDVADAVALLSRTESSWLTGNTIGIDGGELHAAAGAWG